MAWHRWLSSNRTCPVCRKPADRDHRGDDDDSHDTDDRPSGPPRRPPPPDPCSAQSGAQQAPFGRRMQLDDAMWQAELAYRLHGMHRCLLACLGGQQCCKHRASLCPVCIILEGQTRQVVAGPGLSPSTMRWPFPVLLDR